MQKGLSCRQGNSKVGADSSELDSNFSNAVEEELNEGVEEEAGQQVCVGVGLAMDVRSQKEGGRDDCHKSHLHIHSCLSNTCLAERPA